MTSFDYRLHPVRDVLAGGLAYPFGDARAVLQFFGEFMSAAPDELQALAYLTSGGDGTLMVLFVYSGDLNTGEKLINEFRNFRAAKRDWIEPRAYADTYTMPPFSDEGPSCAFHTLRGSYLERLSPEAIDTVLARFAEAPPACEFGFDFDHFMHGEVCRTAPDATAFELRTPNAVHLAFGAEWDGSENTEACTKWLGETWQQLQQYSGGRMYASYISVEGEAAAVATYGRNHSRLVAIKNTYDPANVFRGNLNIRPS